MKKVLLIFLLSLISSLFFAACSSAPSANSNSVMYSNVSSSNSAMANSGGGIGGGKENPALVKQQISLEQADQNQNAPAAVTERKIIRNAEMTLEVEAPEDAQDKIAAIAESKGGFVIESQRQTSDVKATKTDLVTMTARVPAAKFDES